MDYEKKYKETLERAKYYKEGITDHKLENDENILDYIFPELKESEDEKIRKMLIAFVKNDSIITSNKNKQNALAWLEKQGEQKPQGKPALEVWKDMRLEVYQQASGNRHEPNYSDDSTKMFSLADIDEIIEKMSEQNPTDEVKSKFNVGDWIVSEYGTNITVNKIVNVEQIDHETYGYDLDDGSYFSGSWESFYRLWTIQDAKDGDVLATDNDSICIFDGTVEEGKYPFAHGGLTRYGFESYDDKLPFTHDDVHPATKEQCEFLFQKMKEAGYEWDTEKKELKKIDARKNLTLDGDLMQANCMIIESKPTWNEDDELNLKQAIYVCHQNGYTAVENWLESLKDRVQP